MSVGALLCAMILASALAFAFGKSFETFPIMFKLVLIDEQKQNEYRDVKIERWKPLRTKSTNPEYHPEMTPEEFVEAYSLENLDNKVDGYTYEDMVVVVRLAMSIT